MMMTQEQYMTERVDGQIQYYEARSRFNQRLYHQLRVIEIVAAALIPFLTGCVGMTETIPMIVGILGIIIAVITGMMTLYQFQENWMAYRFTHQRLCHEKVLFETQAAPYHMMNAFPLFVKNIEEILMNEHQQWFTRSQASRQETADETGQTPAPQTPSALYGERNS